METDKAEITIETQNNLTEILRNVGIMAIIISAFTFLVQGITNWHSTERLITFAACVLVIVFTSYLCVIFLKDKKSGTALSILGGILTPVLSCAMGGVIYALLYPSSNSGPLKEWFFFNVENVTTAIPALLIGTFVLLISVANASAIYAKIKPLQNLAILLFFNLLLLPPIRSNLTWYLITGLFLYLLTSNKDIVDNLKIKEMRFSSFLSVIPFLALTIIQFRSFLMHSPSILNFSALLLIISSFLFSLKSAEDSKTLKNSILIMTQLALLLGSFEIIILLEDKLFGLHYLGIAYQLATICCLVVGKQISTKLSLKESNIFNNLMLLSTIVFFDTSNNVLSNIITILIGGTMLIKGLNLKERTDFYLGSFMLAFGSFQYFIDLFQYINNYYWLAFFVIGLGCLVGSSVLNRHKEKIIEKYGFLWIR